MKVDRVGSAWPAGLLGIALCLGAVLTAGCAVAGGKTGQAEAVQAAFDGSECRAAERLPEATRAWKAATDWPREEKPPDLAQLAEVEKLYRELVTCLKPAVLAGKLTDPDDLKRFSGAMSLWFRTLDLLGREEEANVLREERAKLADAGLLGVEAMLEQRSRLVGAAWQSGDLTQVRERSEALIAMALEAGVSAEDIEKWIETRRESEIPGVGGPRGEEFTAYFKAAVQARRGLDKLESLFQTSVCGKVALADGGQGKITAKINGPSMSFSVRVKPDGSYCLPVRGNSLPITEGRKIMAYLFFSAQGYRPQAQLNRFAPGKHHNLAEVLLTPMDNPSLGHIVGVAYTTYSLRIADQPVGVEGPDSYYGIASILADRVILIQGEKETYRVTTDTDGVFFKKVPVGIYTIIGKSIGGFPIEVIVNPGETVTTTISFMEMES